MGNSSLGLWGRIDRGSFRAVGEREREMHRERESEWV